VSDALQQQLDRLDGYPSGTADEWLSRYEPIIDEVVRHRRRDTPEISVIVVAWQSADLVVDALDAIDNQQHIDRAAYELVLVDNGGLHSVRDQLAEYVDTEVRMKGNVRLCRARNTAAAIASGDTLVFLDDDGIVAEDYLANATAYFEDPSVVAVRTRIQADDHPLFTALAAHYDRGGEPLEDCLVTEGSSLIRRDDYITAGGFAESLAGHEGIDLTYRLKQHRPDAKILYIPDAVMAHDYYDSWRHFLSKSLQYSDIEQEVLTSNPELGPFLEDFMRRSFPGPRLDAAQLAARPFLTVIRDTLQMIARMRAALADTTA
jgi:glycosyltransferase involved in cell wall biosynthesis